MTRQMYEKRKENIKRMNLLKHRVFGMSILILCLVFAYIIKKTGYTGDCSMILFYMMIGGYVLLNK